MHNQMKSKKAAMELSVTAIVTLILAIVMLGLGLGFIRGMFTKVSTSFDEQISSEPEAALASGAFPITLSRESIITSAGESLVLKVNVYNTNSGATAVAPTITCPGLIDDGTTDNRITQTANDRAINPSEMGTFNLLVTLADTTPTGIQLCSIDLSDIGPKDFTIDVR